MGYSSGIPTSGGTGLAVTADGHVDLPNGVQVDLTTTEGLAEAEGVLDPDQLAELKGLMAAQGYKLEGNKFVPDDTYAALHGPQGTGGPKSTQDGLTAEDLELKKAFDAAGIPFPYNANTTPLVAKKLVGTPDFNNAVAAMHTYFQNPSQDNLKVVVQRFQDACAHTGLTTSYADVLFIIMRESIRSTNEDKKYFLLKLNDFNKMAENLSDYLRDLTRASQTLSQTALGMGDDYNKATVEVETRTYDLSGLDSSGNMPYSSVTKNCTRDDLNALIKGLESDQETIRNKRQMATTSFQNFDQKSQQQFNMMTTLLKTLAEMSVSTIRNML